MGLKQGALRGWLGLFWTNSCGKSSTKVFFCGSGQWRLRAEGGRYLSIQCLQPNIWQPNGSRVLRVGRPLAPAALPPLPRSCVWIGAPSVLLIWIKSRAMGLSAR